MEWIRERLELNPEDTCQQTEELLRDMLQKLGSDGLLIGLSGGLDSAIVAYLSVRSIGKEKVTLLNLPDRDSKGIHQRHAKLIARDLGVQLQIKDITPIIKEVGAYDLLPTIYLPSRRLRGLAGQLGKLLLEGDDNVFFTRLRSAPNTLIAKGNAYAMIKHRIRMVLLYYHAEISNLMVVGAANKTEFLTGTFCKWGCDQCADVMPILHLYRSQLLPIAEYLNVPEKIRTKPADPDIIPGVDNKEEGLLGSFLKTDEILWGLENGIDAEEMYSYFGQEKVERIQSLREVSRHMRESPYVVG